jgi:hypothetical protein
VTPDERAAVAMIGTLPGGPWDFAEGYATAAEYFASIREAAEYHVGCRKNLPVIRTVDNRKPKPRNVRSTGGECIIK